MLFTKYTWSAIGLFVIGNLILVSGYLLFLPKQLWSWASVENELFAVCCIILVYEFVKPDISWGWQHWLRTVVGKGWILFLVALLTGLSDLGRIDSFHVATSTVGNYISFNIFTGVFEEMLFRGLMLALWISYAARTGKSLWWAIVASAVFFGAMHIVNWFHHPQMVYATIGQVGYTFFMGCMLGIIYVVSRSLVSVMAIHAVFNMLGGIQLLFDPALEQTGADISLSALILEWIIFGAITYLYYRKYGAVIREKSVSFVHT